MTGGKELASSEDEILLFVKCAAAGKKSQRLAHVRQARALPISTICLFVCCFLFLFCCCLFFFVFKEGPGNWTQSTDQPRLQGKPIEPPPLPFLSLLNASHKESSFVRLHTLHCAVLTQWLESRACKIQRETDWSFSLPRWWRDGNTPTYSLTVPGSKVVKQ